MLTPRKATSEDIPTLAQIWHDGWHHSHAKYVPKALVAQRHIDSFAPRLVKLGDDVITIGQAGAPLGFVALKNGEIYQLFVAAHARGTDVAEILMRAGEERLRKDGVTSTRFACLEQNHRARAFYRKMGWQEGEIEVEMVETQAAPYPLECLIFHKTL